jgi:hypothetical protein
MTRKKVYGFCKNQWSMFVDSHESLSTDEFLNTMQKYAFVLCVHGGGMDPCPKMWESLICGCIPIIEKSPLAEAIKHILPVVVIDTWELDRISVDKMQQWLNEKRHFFENPHSRREMVERLTLDYWWNIIRDGKTY